MSTALTEKQKRDVLMEGYYQMSWSNEDDPADHALMSMASMLYEIYEKAGNEDYVGDGQGMAVDLFDELLTKGGLLNPETGKREEFEWEDEEPPEE